VYIESQIKKYESKGNKVYNLQEYYNYNFWIRTCICVEVNIVLIVVVVVVVVVVGEFDLNFV
jgi:hypothetical protein